MNNEIFRIVGSVLLKDEEFKKGIANVVDEGEKTSNKLGKALSKVGDIAVKFGKMIAIGTGVAATGLIALTNTAIGAYADYEQLVGGVETLFKDSSEKVLQYANNAYKTAGLSANQYMETVTSYTASLLQSLNGDTAKAADIADMAITDMADNANKMGTSMEMIQNAYNGFAKQNFTMLDNLKLGYGGTKEEMERLLLDAEKLSGQKYDISNLNDIFQAIHIVQTELGITGTTAKEASETISGSLASMKASWTNLITGLGNDKADLKGLIGEFVDSIEIAGKNLIPRIEIIIGGIVELVSKIFPMLIEKIGPMLQNLVPVIANGITNLLMALVHALPSITGAVVDIILQLAKVIMDNMPIILTAIQEVIIQILLALAELAPQLITMLFDMIPQLIDAVISIIDKIIEILPQLITQIVQAIVNGLPKLIDGAVKLFMGIIKAIPKILKALVPEIPKIIDTIVNGLITGLPLLIDGAVQLLMALVEAIPIILDILIPEIPSIVEAIINGLLSCLPVLIEGAITLFMALVQAIPIINMELIKALPQVIASVIQGLIKPLENIFGGMIDFIKTVLQTIWNVASTIFDGVKNTILSIWNAISSTISNVINGIKNTISNVFTNIKNTVSNVWNGIFNAIKAPIEKARDIVKSVIDKIKSFFKFKFEWPKLKMPHFGVKPDGWQIGDLLKGKIPKLSIDWYAKGAIFDKPTLFDTSSGIKGVGEAGPEAAAPISELMKYTRLAVDESNAGLEDKLDMLINLLMNYLPMLTKRQLVLDTGELVGAISPEIDKKLGDINRRRERGN